MQLVVSPVSKTGQSVMQAPAQPAAAASPSAAADFAATAVSASGAAASAAAPPVTTPAKPASSQAAASATAADAAAMPAETGAPSATPAAQPAVAQPNLAALTPPGTAEAAAPPGGAAASVPTGAAAMPPLTPGQIALRNTRDQLLVRDPLSWSVTVYKSEHRLVVYYRGHLYKEYHAVFGRNLDPGTKVWSGDRRTPEGVYTIIAKRLNRRWRYFLKLNYPNDVDRQRYEELVSEGAVPRYRGRAISEGDGIGIHGTDEPILNTGNVNWTTGCISVDNGAIDELEALLPVGTLVIIKR